MGPAGMVKMGLKYGLPFCSITIFYEDKSVTLDNVLVDTGSGGTILKMDRVDRLGITIEKDDVIETISGVGGSEFVFKKIIDRIQLGNLTVRDFTIEVGVMDYGFDINGIIGMDFLSKVGAIINLADMTIYTLVGNNDIK